MFNLGQDISLADENDEHKEASQHVAAVDDSEEYVNRLEGFTGCTIVIVDDEMDTFNCPKDAKNKEQLQIQDLKISFIIKTSINASVKGLEITGPYHFSLGQSTGVRLHIPKTSFLSALEVF